VRLSYRMVPTLPRLAWCARVERRMAGATVTHGPWVETNDHFFSEGAWDGDFREGGFAASVAFFGSGAAVVDDDLVFATATHTYERLHSIMKQDALLVSNSLAFLLSQAGEEIDPAYPFYDVDLMSFKLGVRRVTRSIPTRSGAAVRLHYCCNVVVDERLRIREQPKRYCEPFTDFAQYTSYLRTEVTRLAANASDDGRARRYEPLSSVSAGYDSPAVSLFAREVGCTEAITFTEARPGYGASDDSGTAIGELLGLEVHEFSRTSYMHRQDCPEAEFLASGTGGEEVVFVAAEDLLGGRLFFTGYFGDAAWSRRWPHAGSEFRVRHPAGASFAEFRLRIGFINFALPVLGFIHQLGIHRISNSDEMRLWCTGTGYDKPIPRRLLEEAGVPGSMFGQQKMAVAQPFYNVSNELPKVMGKSSYADFQRFADRLKLFPGSRFALQFRAGRAAYMLNERVNWRIEKFLARRGRSLLLDPLVSRRYEKPLRWNAYTFHWGTAKVMSRYAFSAADEVGGTSMAAD
jgi:hypothetical protein